MADFGTLTIKFPKWRLRILIAATHTIIPVAYLFGAHQRVFDVMLEWVSRGLRVTVK